MKLTYKNRIKTSIILVLLLSLTTYADSTKLYAITGAGNVPSILYELNSSTGAVIATIGATGQSHLTGLAVHPATGVLYAVKSDLGGTGGVSSGASGETKLFTLNPTNGTATEIGDTGAQIPDIAFDASGILYGWDERDAGGEPDDLVTINLMTGLATIVGESGIATTGPGLAFDSAGTLFVSSTPFNYELFTINPGTGSATFLLNLSEFINNALAFDANDVLYSMVRTGGTSLLKTVNITTGVVTDIGDIGVAGISAIAFTTSLPAATVPTLSEWGIIALIVTLAITAAFAVRKKFHPIPLSV